MRSAHLDEMLQRVEPAVGGVQYALKPSLARQALGWFNVALGVTGFAAGLIYILVSLAPAIQSPLFGFVIGPLLWAFLLYGLPALAWLGGLVIAGRSLLVNRHARGYLAGLYGFVHLFFVWALVRRIQEIPESGWVGLFLVTGFSAWGVALAIRNAAEDLSPVRFRKVLGDKAGFPMAAFVALCAGVLAVGRVTRARSYEVDLKRHVAGRQTINLALGVVADPPIQWPQLDLGNDPLPAVVSPERRELNSRGRSAAEDLYSAIDDCDRQFSLNRCHHLAKLMRLAAELGGADAVPHLKQWLVNKDGYLGSRLAAATELARMKHAASASDIAALLGEPSSIIGGTVADPCVTAVAALVALEATSQAPALEAIFAKGGFGTRCGGPAAIALVALGARESVLRLTRDDASRRLLLTALAEPPPLPPDVDLPSDPLPPLSKELGLGAFRDRDASFRVLGCRILLRDPRTNELFRNKIRVSSPRSGMSPCELFAADGWEQRAGWLEDIVANGASAGATAFAELSAAGPYVALAAARDGALVTADRQGVVRFWTVMSGRLNRELATHLEDIRQIAIDSSMGALFVLGAGGLKAFWLRGPPSEPVAVANCGAPAERTTAFYLLASRGVLVGGTRLCTVGLQDHKVTQRFDLQAIGCGEVLSLSTFEVPPADYAAPGNAPGDPETSLVAATCRNVIGVWNLEDAKLVARIDGRDRTFTGKFKLVRGQSVIAHSMGPTGASLDVHRIGDGSVRNVPIAAPERLSDLQLTGAQHFVAAGDGVCAYDGKATRSACALEGTPVEHLLIAADHSQEIDPQRFDMAAAPPQFAPSFANPWVAMAVSSAHGGPPWIHVKRMRELVPDWRPEPMLFGARYMRP